MRGPVFSPSAVEYEKVVPFKVRLLETAWSRFSAGARPDLLPAYEEFRQDHGLWLDDYALFRALKARYHGACYLEWPVDTGPTCVHEQLYSGFFEREKRGAHGRREFYVEFNL